MFGVPAGAIGALTIKRTISNGVIAGLLSGFGCSFADLIYACISVFGLSLLSDFFLRLDSIITVLGGLFIVAIGIGIILKRNIQVEEEAKASKLLSFVTSSFFIAMTNPATIFSFILAFSVFGVGEINSSIQGISLISGIFIGNSIWWIFIVTLIYMLKKKLSRKIIGRINYCLGSLIILFGSVVLIGSVF